MAHRLQTGVAQQSSKAALSHCHGTSKFSAHHVMISIFFPSGLFQRMGKLQAIVTVKVMRLVIVAAVVRRLEIQCNELLGSAVC